MKGDYGVFSIDECTNISKNRHQKFDIVKYFIKRILINKSIIYEMHFVILNTILDYWRREKKGRYELDVWSYYLRLDYEEYRIMRRIIKSDGIRGFEEFLKENIKEYFTEIYNYDELKTNNPELIRGDIDESLLIIQKFQEPIQDINDPKDIVGIKPFEYLGIDENDIDKQKEIIQKLIVKAY